MKTALKLFKHFRLKSWPELCRNTSLSRRNEGFNVMNVRERLFHASLLGRQGNSETQKVTDLPVLASLKERGLYHHDQYKHTADKKIVSSDISSDGKTVDITWNDSHKSTFHAIWLRHFCHCPQCRLPHSDQTKVNFDLVDVDSTRITSVEFEGDKVVLLKWQTDGGEGEHEGHMATNFLRINCYSDESLKHKREERAMKFYDEKIVPELDYNEVSSSEEGLSKWVLALSNTGLSLLKNVPAELNYVAKVAELIAPVQHTIYGEIFDVISKIEPENAAYSDVRLLYHMDQPNYESPPGLQLLHCLKFDEAIEGGVNRLVDIHEVAHKFRKQQPELFDALAWIPYTAETISYKSDFSFHLRHQRPIFALNHLRELVSVYWQPQLVGATQVAKEDVEPFYRAYQVFYRMVNHYPSYYQLRLRPGDLISFNNRRLVHARSAFSSTHGERHLQRLFHGFVVLLHGFVEPIYVGGPVVSTAGHELSQATLTKVTIQMGDSVLLPNITGAVSFSEALYSSYFIRLRELTSRYRNSKAWFKCSKIDMEMGAWP